MLKSRIIFLSIYIYKKKIAFVTEVNINPPSIFSFCLLFFFPKIYRFYFQSDVYFEYPYTAVISLLTMNPLALVRLYYTKCFIWNTLWVGGVLIHTGRILVKAIISNR